MIYCTLLNPALDVLYPVDEFHPGSTLTDLQSEMIPAGKGMNVARVVRLLGEEVCVVGLVAEHDYGRFAAFLERSQIDHVFYHTPGSVRVNVTIAEKNGQVSHLNAVGLSATVRMQEEFLELQNSRLSAGDLWCFSGSTPQGFDSDVYAKMIRSVNKVDSSTILDTRGTSLKIGIRAKPLMVKPNLLELEGFFGEQIQGVHHIALKGKRLLDMGVSYAFISLGADGMIAIHENDCLLCSPPQVRVIDTVGCGDALVAGLLVARKRNFSFPEMCRMAIACGTSKAMHRGPAAVTRDEVWQLMEDVRITSV